MYEAAFKLQMIDDQTAAFHMKDLHACAHLVDEDEHVDVLHVEAHLVGDDTAQRVEALAHVRRMRIQEEPVGVRQAEHPLSPYRYQLAERLCGDFSRQADSHAVGKDDFADRMSHFHSARPLSAGEDDLPPVHGKPRKFFLYPGATPPCGSWPASSRSGFHSSLSVRRRPWQTCCSQERPDTSA